MATLIETARLSLQGAIRGVLIGSAEPVAGIARSGGDDPGLFGPGSATWTVHSDAAILIGGIRALLLQTMHPLAMAGVADHSAYRTDPTGRLWRTSAYVGATTFGTTEQATQAVAIVRRVHESVVGTAADGRAYAANDPHLLGWVHHTLVDSFLRAHQRYGDTPLTPVDADRYVAEQARLAELIGAVDPEPARSVSELRAWMWGIRPELRAGAQARVATRFLLFPPLALATRPPFAVLASAAIGLLPGWVRRDLRIPTVPFADALVVRPSARALSHVVGWALR